MSRKPRSPCAPFLIVLTGLVLAAVPLILLIPALFGPHQPWLERAAGVLGCLVLAFGWGVLRLRPEIPRTDRPSTEQ